MLLLLIKCKMGEQTEGVHNIKMVVFWKGKINAKKKLSMLITVMAVWLVSMLYKHLSPRSALQEHMGWYLQL